MNVCMNAWKINFGFNIVRADLGTINFFCIPVSDNSSTADKIWWNGELYVTYILRYVFLHLETIVRSVYMELWFVTAVSSPVSLVTARQVTYWTKFGPSRLGQRVGGREFPGRQDCPTSDVQVFFISKIQGELRNVSVADFAHTPFYGFLNAV